ncbi:MAG: PP2C family protein-serine/threonine phosphatase [Bacteroidota bacterium]
MALSQTDNRGAEEIKKEVQQLTDTNKRLRRAVDELSTLNDLSFAISGSVDREKIMRTIIHRSIRSIEAEQGDITLVDENQDTLTKTLVRSMVRSKNVSPQHLNQNLLGWMQIHKKPLLINNPTEDPRFRHVEWESAIRSILSAPLMTRNKLIGILTLYNKEDRTGFTEDDQRLLSIIATQSAQVVENARLHEEEQILIEMRKEIELAAKIQKQLLPAEQPKIKGYSLCGRNLTAHSVGGDYYDFIPLGPNRWAICLGDVSGKGLPASLLMANLQAILRGQVRYQSSPGMILQHANRQLFQSTDTEKYVTLFLGFLDADAHTMQYSIGGHEYPFWMHSDNNFSRLTTGGIPIGIMENQPYQEETIAFNPGDRLVIYSDGIADSRNADGEAFTEERLQKLLIQTTNNTGQQLMDSIFNASLEHNNTLPLFDDMTMVVLCRNP